MICPGRKTHDWAVFSSAEKEGWLILQCAACRVHGVVKTPTVQEFQSAMYAGVKPYGWSDASRVTPKGYLPSHMVYVEREWGEGEVGFPTYRRGMQSATRQSSYSVWIRHNVGAWPSEEERT